jgi:putative glutamine amidotransferase
MGKYRPRIGITMRIELETDRFYLSRHYSEAVEAAGGTPVHISLIPNPEYLNSAVAGIDGLLLPGSDSDVDPLLYNREPHQALGQVHPIKDQTDLLAIAAAEKMRVPIFSICFGMQVLNVARGGTLIQDIPSQVPDAIKHTQGAPRDRGSHRVAILESSLLSTLAKNDSAIVNSHHHQAIETLGADLVATAWSADGLVEAYEDSRADNYALGVQWHPELGWERDEFSQAIFRDFLNRARQYNETKSNSNAVHA